MNFYRWGALVALIIFTLGLSVYVPRSQAASATGPDVTLITTVGLDPHTCSTDVEITVPAGTSVTYCYTVTNNTGVTLTAHTLQDSILGTLLPDYGYLLTVGSSLSITTTTVVNTSTTNTGTWNATSPMGYTISEFLSCGTNPDITATGTALNLADDAAVDVALAASFPFYDTYLTTISVSNNGSVTTPGGIIPPTNESFPNATYRRVIAPYWDDLDEETGNVYVGDWSTAVTAETVGSPAVPPGATAESGPLTYFVVEWYDRPHYPGPGDSGATLMLAMLYPGQGYDGYMFTCYVDTDFGDPLYNGGISATVGLNQNGVNSHLYSFNNANAIFSGGALAFTPQGLPQQFSAAESAVVNVVAPEIDISPTAFNVGHPAPQASIEFMTIGNNGNGPLNWNITEAAGTCGNPGDISWLGVSPTGGTIEPQEGINATVSFDSTALQNGVYDALLCISSNDTDESLIEIPVQLSVGTGATPTPTATLPVPTVTPTGTPTGPGDYTLYLPMTRRR